MIILGYFLAVLIGISLGLIGSGGSILTVPLLVYVFQINPTLAIAYSLFIVGSSALVGSIKKVIRREVKLKTGLYFGLPSILTIYLTRKFIIPRLPDEFFTIGGFVLTRDIFIMLLFAAFMMVAAVAMIRNKNVEPSIGLNTVSKKLNYPMVVLQGILVGLLAGFVGAGGGFLIIPVLVFMLAMPMKEAIGTSLAIVALNSLIGFLGDVQNLGPTFNWVFLLSISTISITGIFIGMYLTTFISGGLLKKAFGYVVLVMGIYILLKELL